MGNPIMVRKKTIRMEYCSKLMRLIVFRVVAAEKRVHD